MVRFSIWFENRTVSPDRRDVGVGGRGVRDGQGVGASAVGGWRWYPPGRTAGEAGSREKDRSSVRTCLFDPPVEMSVRPMLFRATGSGEEHHEREKDKGEMRTELGPPA